jgi:hypothetical protein
VGLLLLLILLSDWLVIFDVLEDGIYILGGVVLLGVYLLGLVFRGLLLNIL